MDSYTVDLKEALDKAEQENMYLKLNVQNLESDNNALRNKLEDSDRKNKELRDKLDDSIARIIGLESDARHKEEQDQWRKVTGGRGF